VRFNKLRGAFSSSSQPDKNLYVCVCVCVDHCACSMESFDTARKAHGTDHDILFVFSDTSHDLTQTADFTAGDPSHDVQL